MCSESSIERLTDQVVSAIHMSIEASAPWYHFQAVKWACVSASRGPLSHGRSQQRPSTLTQNSVVKMVATLLLRRRRPYSTVSNPANIKRRRTSYLSATNPKNRQRKYHIQKNLLPAYLLRKSHPGHDVWELLDQLPRRPIDKKEILRSIRGRVARNTASTSIDGSKDVLGSISAAVTPALVVLFNQCFGARLFPSLILKAQLSASPNFEGLSYHDSNSRMRFAVLRAIGQIFDAFPCSSMVRSTRIDVWGIFF